MQFLTISKWFCIFFFFYCTHQFFFDVLTSKLTGTVLKIFRYKIDTYRFLSNLLGKYPISIDFLVSFVNYSPFFASIYWFQYFWGYRIWICHYFSCPTYLEAKIGPQMGDEIQSFRSKYVIHISISIFLGMPNLNLPLFFMSDPSGG